MAGMDIRQAQLATRSLDDTARFWERLGCPVDRADGVVEVVVGSTRLLFRELPGMTGALHLAITIPAGTFDLAAEWIAGIATVLVDADRRDAFEGPPNWNSRSVYFEGPDQQLLELIERRDLVAPDSSPTPTQQARASPRSVTSTASSSWCRRSGAGSRPLTACRRPRLWSSTSGWTPRSSSRPACCCADRPGPALRAL